MKRITVIALIVIVALLLAFPGAGQILSAEGEAGLENLTGWEPVKKGHPKIESRLYNMVNKGKEEVVESSSVVKREALGTGEEKIRVIVEVASGSEETVTEDIRSLGGEVEISYNNMIQVLIPLSQIETLSNNDSVKLVRLPYEYVLDAVSEGVSVINADTWQGVGFTGSGVKIGVLDAGFSGYEALKGTDLPSSITTWWAPSRGGPGTSIHGTGCAEIVYDIAPDAQYYFANFTTDVEWIQAISWLVAQDVDVISHSAGWPTGGPGNGTGHIDEAVTAAVAAGIVWCQAAGNSAQRHWSGYWQSNEEDIFYMFAPSDFGQTFMNRQVGEVIRVALVWNDPWGYSSNDYDLLLVGPEDSWVAWSQNRQDGDENDYPSEYFSYTVPQAGIYYIVIAKNSASGNPLLRLISSNHDLEHIVAAGSMVPPADSPDAITVGAVPWNNPSVLEPYSSQGPTVDGRTKPDLVAPDAVSTVSYGAGAFKGTSASAPHLVGAAALVKQAYPSYTPAQVQSFLEGRAEELGSPGKDNLYGSGKLNLDVANAPPVAGFTSNTTSGTAPLTVQFTDQSISTITGWSWNFGDGGTSTLQNPSYQYTSVGTYSVSLTATGPGGSDTETKTDYITVTTPPPVAQFTADITSGAVPLTVQFTDQSTGNVTGWSWNFGDGGTSTDTSPSHDYTLAGTHTVTLTVTGPGGNDSEVKTDYITVQPGAVHHICITPANPSVTKGYDLQFSAVVCDEYNNTRSETPTYIWSVTNGTAGSIIADTGLFTAGSTGGNYPDVIRADATVGGPIYGTTGVNVSDVVNITVTVELQGTNRPVGGYDIPLTMKWYSQGTVLNSGNIMTEPPLQTYTKGQEIDITDTDTENQRITLAVTGVPAGVYNITLGSDGTLIHLKNGQAIDEGNSVDMGIILEGDANLDGAIGGADFGGLIASYWATPTIGDWQNGVADFDKNGIVNALDYSLISANYFKESPQIVSE